jgi:hypothetical protein
MHCSLRLAQNQHIHTRIHRLCYYLLPWHAYVIEDCNQSSNHSSPTASQGHHHSKLSVTTCVGLSVTCADCRVLYITLIHAAAVLPRCCLLCLLQDQAGGSSSLKAASTTANPIIDDIASFAESDDMAVDTSTVKTEPVAAHNSSSSSNSSSSPAIDTGESLWNTLVNVLQVTPQQEQLLASKVAIAQVSYPYNSYIQQLHIRQLRSQPLYISTFSLHSADRFCSCYWSLNRQECTALGSA